MEFSGEAMPTLESCSFIDCSWKFTGAAGRTVEFMGAVYKGMGEGGRKMIEETYENIMRGNYGPGSAARE